MPTIRPHDDRRWVMLEWWFAAACLALFVYSVLAWQGLVGGEPPWRPGQAVLLSGGLLLQPLAALARPRHAERLVGAAGGGERGG
jgi:hypothetical protein